MTPIKPSRFRLKVYSPADAAEMSELYYRSARELGA